MPYIIVGNGRTFCVRDTGSVSGVEGIRDFHATVILVIQTQHMRALVLESRELN
jgi:hypothetical protein